MSYRDLARLAFVSYRAGHWANPACRIGMQLCYPESLGFLLDDKVNPLAGNCDFIDYHAYAGPRSDDECFRGDGLVPVLRAMQAEYAKRKLPQPEYLCTETGVSGGEPGSEAAMTQAAAAIKVNVVGAAVGLVATCWYGLADPSWQNMGLVADVSKLPGDGSGARLKEAYDALRTVAMLLGEEGLRFDRELESGEGTHAYRFKGRAGRMLVVVWADDKASASVRATAKLSLEPGRWERLAWDYARSGKAEGTEPVGAQPLILSVGAAPVFLRR